MLGIMALLCSLEAAALTITDRYAWKGTLGQRTSFRLELEQNANDLVMGQMTYYRRDGSVRKIAVYGTFIYSADGNWMALQEFVGTKICGYMSIVVDGTNMKEGTWSYGEKQLEMHDVQNVEMQHKQTFFQPADGKGLHGEFSFTYDSSNPNFPEYGGNAVIATSGQHLNWRMTQVTPNIAEGSGSTSFTGNTFADTYGNFKFRAWVYKDVLYVKRTNPEDGDCEDFGAWATLEGIYIREK